MSIPAWVQHTLKTAAKDSRYMPWKMVAAVPTGPNDVNTLARDTAPALKRGTQYPRSFNKLSGDRSINDTTIDLARDTAPMLRRKIRIADLQG